MKKNKVKIHYVREPILKRILFYVLKILEVLAVPAVYLGLCKIGYLIAISFCDLSIDEYSWYHIYYFSITEVILLIIIAIILLVTILPKIIKKWIKVNKRLTDKIYNYFKNK